MTASSPPGVTESGQTQSRAARIAVIFCLILAGEAVFSLPFHVSRYFRATTLDVFGFSNAQLGDVFAVYGVAAMIAYFPGGTIADHFSPRRLIAMSLVATGAGGLYMATIPGAAGMAALYGYWGVTTILLFWAAMIRATREWGGTSSQGLAFGILDGGRGAVAAVMASAAALLFTLLMPEQSELLGPDERRAALQSVIYFYSAMTVGVGLFCWFAIPEPESGTRVAHDNPMRGMAKVLRTPAVWGQAVVVVCAYCGYKGLDNYSLYAVQVLGMDEAEAAQFTAATAYIRPIAAVAAGFLADRVTARNVIALLFTILVFSYGMLWQLAPSPELQFILYANIFVSFAGVFGLRGVYFALLEETRVPRSRTGAAVGLVSVVGYTPDVFYAPIAGRILDRSPGIVGHQHNFLLLAAIAATGCLVVLALRHLTPDRDDEASSTSALR